MTARSIGMPASPLPLDTFDATALLVGHDRRTLDGFHATRRPVLEGGTVRRADAPRE